MSIQWRNVGGSNPNTGTNLQQQGIQNINQGFKNALDFNLQKQRQEQSILDKNREANTSMIASRIANAKTEDEMKSIMQEATESGNVDLNKLTAAQKLQGKDIYSKGRVALDDERYDTNLALDASNRKEDNKYRDDRDVVKDGQFRSTLDQTIEKNRADAQNAAARIAAERARAKAGAGEVPEPWFNTITGQTEMRTPLEQKAILAKDAYQDKQSSTVAAILGQTIGGNVITKDKVAKLSETVEGRKKLKSLESAFNNSAEEKWNDVNKRKDVVAKSIDVVDFSSNLNQSEKNMFIESIGKKLQQAKIPLTPENISRYAQFINKNNRDDFFVGGKFDSFGGALDSEYENLEQSVDKIDVKRTKQFFDQPWENIDAQNVNSIKQVSNKEKQRRADLEAISNIM